MAEQTATAHDVHEPPEVAELDAILGDPDGPCPNCLRLLVTRLVDERDAARHRDGQADEQQGDGENGGGQ